MFTEDKQELKSMDAIHIHLYCKQNLCFLALTCLRITHGSTTFFVLVCSIFINIILIKLMMIVICLNH